jgi:DNA-binding NarL/FixJ family response regulator
MEILSKAIAPIRVVLVADLALLRQGIRAVLKADPDLELVGEADNADEAVRLARALVPHVVLIDQDISAGGGLEVTRRIKEAIPEIAVVVMAGRLDGAKALQAVEAGAMGYILKDIPGPNLAGAIRSVCGGRAFLPPAVTRKLQDRLGGDGREKRARDRMETNGLTPRELDILVEVAKGRTDHEIASSFVLAEGTVKTHIRHVLRKLSARNRAQAVAHVLRKGLIK